MQSTKKCNICGKILDVKDFGILTAAKDGLNPTCKKCKLERERKWLEKRAGRIIKPTRSIKERLAIVNDYLKKKKQYGKRLTQKDAALMLGIPQSTLATYLSQYHNGELDKKSVDVKKISIKPANTSATMEVPAVQSSANETQILYKLVDLCRRVSALTVAIDALTTDQKTTAARVSRLTQIFKDELLNQE